MNTPAVARTKTSVEAKLELLNNLDTGIDSQDVKLQIKSTINDRHYRVAAKAATLCAERLLYDLEPDLLAAYRQFLQNPVKRDPNCIAKAAIARALIDLECQDIPFFIEGLHYCQLEPVWGGSVDTAIDVRCSCAMGLVATGYHRALHELSQLLNDSEANARLGAVRAIACANPREAELLLRFKALVGDPDPAVIGECFTGLLHVEPDESLPFVARFLSVSDEAIRELAALALGESRQDDALGFLIEAWDEFIEPGPRRSLIRAVVFHRSDAAFDWVLAVIEQAESSLAEFALEALAIYKHNTKLTSRVSRALATRNEQRLRKQFDALWD